MIKYFSSIRFLFVALVLNFLFATQVSATHIVGGEINYKYLGSNNYEIRLTIYRDCYNGVPYFDDPASLGFFNMNNILVDTLFMTLNPSDTIDPYLVSPCLVPPVDVCYEVSTYIDTINLPPIQGGYQLVYQRCCRNATIVNIQNPSDAGITIYGYIPDQNLVAVNSNPVFKSWPPPFICISYPFVWDNSATDLDGDSIVYEMMTPFDGATSASPMPQPPDAPPYPNILWKPPYSLNNVMGGVAMSIDSYTGELTAIPNSLGQFVIGVLAKEFRNGILLSATRRDFQINVVDCPNLVSSAITVPEIICGTTTVVFQNNSLNANSFFWNFGDNTTLADTSIAISPAYTYPDTGFYSVTLIAYSPQNTACNDTLVKTIHLISAYQTDFSFTVDTCTGIVNFMDTILTTGNTTVGWNWNFGNGFGSNQPNPVYQYPAAGNYTIQLITFSADGCSDTTEKSISIPLGLKVNSTTITSSLCNGDCSGQILVNIGGGTSPYSYQWSLAGQPDSPVLDSLCAGSYTVTVTDDRNCTFSYSTSLTDPSLLSSALSSSDAYCFGACIGSATAFVNGGTGAISFLWNDVNAQTTSTASQLCPGTYAVLITDQNGCTKIDSVVVDSTSFIPPVNATTDDNELIIGQSTHIHAVTSNTVSYAWTPPDGLSSTTSQNPLAQPTVTTTYTVVITDANGCSNLDSVTIVVRIALCAEPEVYVPNAFSPNNDLHNDIFIVRGQAVKEVRMQIYDRWGQLVFETTSANVGWDGKFKGKDLAPAVYDYWVEVTCWDKEIFFKKGNITLIR